MDFNACDSFYFSENHNKSLVIGITSWLKEEADAEMLAKAVNEALELFPNYQNRPYINAEGHIVSRKNESPVPVYYDDNVNISLGTDESNGYLFRFVYKGKKICMYSFHALGDGSSAFMFFTHVMFFYLTNLGHKIDGSGIILNEIPQTADDDLAKKALQYLEKVKENSQAESNVELSLEEKFIEDFPMEHYNTENARSIFIECDNQSYLNYCKNNKVSSTALLVDLISKAAYEVYGVKDKRMEIAFAVDMRKQFASESYHNFAIGKEISYDYDMVNMDVAKRYDTINSRMKQLLDQDVLTKTAAEYGQYSTMLSQYYTLANHKLVEEKMREQQKDKRTSYYISNIGKLRVPNDFYQYIDNIYHAGNPARPETNYYAGAYNNIFSLIVRQNFDDIRVAERIVEEFNSLGIAAAIKENIVYSYDYVSIEKFLTIR